MTEVFFHIGTHKTGTTTIQHALRKASGTASAQEGWECLVYPQSATNLMYAQAYDKAIVKEFTQELSKKLVCNDGLSKLIISHEGLSGQPDNGYMNSKIIATMLRDITSDFNVKIIIYLRRQDEMIESMYTQKIHEGGTLEFSEFVSQLSHGLSYNYSRILDDWASCFGKENLIVRSYHSASQRGLLEDFGEVSSINIDVHAEFRRSNPSYSYDAIQIARIANATLGESSKKILRRALQKTMAKDKQKAHSLYSVEQRKEILDIYMESNQNVADQFFGGDLDNLFPKLKQDPLALKGWADPNCITPENVAALVVELLPLGKGQDVPAGLIEGAKVAISGYPRLKSFLRRILRQR